MATSGLSGAAVDPSPHGRRWLLGVGLVLLALGGIGLAMSLTRTVVGVAWYGTLLIVAGTAQVIEAVLPSDSGERWNSRVLRLMLGMLYGAAGLYAVFRPATASLALTLALGLLLLASGAIRAAWMLGREGRRSRGLGLLLAFVSVALGLGMISQWPLSGLWAIGFFLSADLIAYGLSWCGAAYSGRTSRARPSTGSSPQSGLSRWPTLGEND